MSSASLDTIIAGFQSAQDHLCRQISAKRRKFVELNRQLEVMEREFDAGAEAIAGIEKLAETLPENETLTLRY